MTEFAPGQHPFDGQALAEVDKRTDDPDIKKALAAEPK